MIMESVQTFYTIAYIDKDGWEYVNILEVDFENKTYSLCKNQDSMILGGEDEYGNTIYETYIEPIIFEIIIEGIQKRGFTEIQYAEDNKD